MQRYEITKICRGLAAKNSRHLCAFPKRAKGFGPRSVAGHGGFSFRRQDPIHEPAEGPAD